MMTDIATVEHMMATSADIVKTTGLDGDIEMDDGTGNPWEIAW